MVKGYLVAAGYMGWVEDHYMLFATEAEYLEYIR